MAVMIRKAAWAGQFYPSHPMELTDMIQRYFDHVPREQSLKNVFGLIVPHAGYAYSGKTAAAGFKQIQDQEINTVVVISPSHAQLLEGVSIYDGDAYETPLGQVPVAAELAQKMAAQSPHLHLSKKGHESNGDRAEHALEVQLPFLQTALQQKFELVPLVFHEYTWVVCHALGQALASVYHPGMLIVASSDLYHGYSYDECVRSDNQTLEAIKTGNAESFCQGALEDRYQACGAGPIAALLSAATAKGATQIKTLNKTNSSDVTGSRGGWTVGYASIWIGWPAGN